MVTTAGFDRAGNVLGAVALGLVDRIDETVTEAAGQPGSAAAALSALHFLIDRPSIDALRRVLGVTSSGAVRLVDRLEELGYVRRTAGDDARTTFVVLTAAGTRAAARVAEARAASARGRPRGPHGPRTPHVRHAARKGRGRDDAGARCGPLDLPVVRHRDVRALRRSLPDRHRGCRPLRRCSLASGRVSVSLRDDLQRQP